MSVRPPLPPAGMALLIAALATLAPFSIDTYLPSFPEIAERLHASPLQVQQTLTVYMLTFAVMSLWHGAISDSIGRRTVLLWCLALYSVFSLGATFATSIEQLWLMRAAQGVVAGAGTVVGRAVVRDLFEGPAAQKLMSHVTMAFAIAPAVAPIVGGWLHTWFGWRSIFAFLTLVGAALWLTCHRWMPETLPLNRRQPLHPAYLLRTYWKVLTSPAFVSATLAVSCNFTGFFLYVMSAPVFLLQHLHVGETEFYWLFVPGMAGLMLGAFISGRVAGRVSRPRTLGIAYLLMAAAALFNLLLNAALPPSLPLSVLPIFPYTIGMSLAMPSLTLSALDLFPDQRGLASSCQSALQSLVSALAAGVLAPLFWPSTLTLASGMAMLLSAGGAFGAMHLWLIARKPASA